MRSSARLFLALQLLVAASAHSAGAAPALAYRPHAQVSGLIRNYGFGLGGALAAWERAFNKYQPGVTFKDTLPTSDAAFPGLVTGIAVITFNLVGTALRDAMEPQRRGK